MIKENVMNDDNKPFHVAMDKLRMILSLPSSATSLQVLEGACSALEIRATAPDIWRGLMQAADEVVEKKGRDYTKGSADRLANFKNSGADAGIRPLQAWLVFFKKHVDAVFSYVKTGGQSESEPIFGRFVDVLNYTRLGWLLVAEEQDHGAKSKEDLSLP
jgi:hypothetical protein